MKIGRVASLETEPVHLKIEFAILYSFLLELEVAFNA